jgi:hypothetical protein
MHLFNMTKMQAGYTMGVQPDGRELLVVVVKGTFTIPESGQEAELAAEQVPLVEMDVYSGEPAFSAPLYEIDFAPRKPRCDVLLDGSAYAPGGKPIDRVTVSLRVGSLTKSVDVVGNRIWKAGVLYMAASSPEPFTVMPISYNNAFGGIDKAMDDPEKWRYFLPNHAGVGYHEYTSGKYMDGKPLPNTEESGRKISNPKGSYRPMAFGPLGRAWQPRVKLAGTYDKDWLENVFPFLPADFDERYYQAAPADQQTDFLQGGEEVELKNLTPQGQTIFKLPAMKIPFEFAYKNGDSRQAVGNVDTLVLEPNQSRFTLTSRVCQPLQRNLHELRFVVAGLKPYVAGTEQEAEAPPGKRRFRSLADLAAWNRVGGI